MVVSIMQPAYLPWLGYFDRIHKSDVHIVLDHVEIDKNSKTKFANRNKIRTKEGMVWLTVPIQTKGNYGSLFIDKIKISNDEQWAKKHWNTIRHNYSKAPYFQMHSAFLEDIYQQNWEYLNDLIKEITNYLLKSLNIETKILYSSDMGLSDTKSDLIYELCKEVKGTHYSSGKFGKDYLDEQHFLDGGIEIEYHQYEHPEYSQVYEGFEANMSVIDLLFTHGENSLNMITGNTN